ncbi:hypothetical protein AB1Y20_002838 [Prymnesium parvum]|uniref:Peptide-O-fucosyltransferase 1 n=1 Tax=Prymnesium parvum TaxID=97485 RepID=A0AB34J9R3_PRYPA
MAADAARQSFTQALREDESRSFTSLLERKQHADELVARGTSQLAAVDGEMHDLLGAERYARFSLAWGGRGAAPRGVEPHGCADWCAADARMQQKPWSLRCSFVACGRCAECSAPIPPFPLGGGGGGGGGRGNHTAHGGQPRDGGEEGTASAPSSCPERSVTACCKGDGFGAQYLALMSVFAYSLAANLTFCPTSWAHVQHGVDSLDAGHGALSMFAFVGGPLYGPPALPHTRKVETMYASFEKHASGTDAIARIRAHYFATPRPALKYFAAARKTVAVHVRRGDVTPKDEQRWTSIEQIAACVEKVLDELQQPAAVHVFSDGSAEQLAGLERFNATVHLRDNVKAAFHHMVQADALVMAKSSLSGTAAILRSQGWNFPAERGAGCID